MLAIQKARPAFVATSIITGEDRSPRVVLEANRAHDTARTARLERVVFRNDLSPQEALDAVCDREGEMDIVSEVSPADAARVEQSEHARLVAIDANRLIVGLFNCRADHDAPLTDVRMREALNLAVDRHRMAAEGLGGHATPRRRSRGRARGRGRLVTGPSTTAGDARCAGGARADGGRRHRGCARPP